MYTKVTHFPQNKAGTKNAATTTSQMNRLGTKSSMSARTPSLNTVTIQNGFHFSSNEVDELTSQPDRADISNLVYQADRVQWTIGPVPTFNGWPLV